MKPLTPDKQKAVVEDRDNGLTIAATARKHGIGIASVSRVMKRRREGKVDNRNKPGPQAKLDENAIQLIKMSIAGNNALSLQLLLELLVSHGYAVSRSTICRKLQAMGFTYNKGKWRKKAISAKSKVKRTDEYEEDLVHFNDHHYFESHYERPEKGEL